MSVASFAALGLVEHLYRYEFALFVTGNNHLGNAFAVVDNKRFLREVDE